MNGAMTVYSIYNYYSLGCKQECQKQNIARHAFVIFMFMSPTLLIWLYP